MFSVEIWPKYTKIRSNLKLCQNSSSDHLEMIMYQVELHLKIIFDRVRFFPISPYFWDISSFLVRKSGENVEFSLLTKW